MSTQGHGMIEEPDTVEARYLPKCLSGDNHQGNCHNYVFDYVYVTIETINVKGCTTYQKQMSMFILYQTEITPFVIS